MANATQNSQPRIKEDIIDYGDDEEDERSIGDEDMENDNSETDADEQSINEGLEAENDEADKEIVLPDTVEGLRDRFNQLFIAFTREKKTEHRHALALLLDEMLDREYITQCHS